MLQQLWPGKGWPLWQAASAKQQLPARRRPARPCITHPCGQPCPVSALPYLTQPQQHTHTHNPPTTTTHPPTHPHHCDTVFLFPSIGNAPTLMSMEDMKRVIPVFFNMSIEVHNDEAATKEWGWVQASGCRRGVCREQAAFP